MSARSSGFNGNTPSSQPGQRFIHTPLSRQMCIAVGRRALQRPLSRPKIAPRMLRRIRTSTRCGVALIAQREALETISR